MTVVVRAHNEQDQIGFVVAELAEAGWSPIVALSGCTDATPERAESAGGTCIVVPAGLGAATSAILARYVAGPVVLVDGDLTRVPLAAVAVLDAAARAGFVAKGAFDRAGRASSALPGQAAAAGVELPPVPPQALATALSAYPARFAERVDLARMPQNRGSDLTLSLLAHEAGYQTVVVPVGARDHSPRGEDHVAHLRASNAAALAAFAASHGR